MNKFFYPKLAISNIKKNSKTYFPFILTAIITVAMFYNICSLANNEGLDLMIGGGEMRMMLGFGVYVVGFFAIIFLFYTNSFLMKRRKKEFGLFNILGMEKRHVALIIVYETIITALCSLIFGFILGISLDKLLFMLISRMFDASLTLGFAVSFKAMKTTIQLFMLIFLLMFINTVRQINLSNPIELLHSQQFGEKEPKSKWLMTILGLISLGIGYYISVTTKNPISAMLLFFVAVILVIIGTYLLFTAGSITFLKTLKKKKKYYYQPTHFISLSGMIYRMKQNAIGLANICILSTMVLVMLSTTLSLWIGIDDLANTRYPRDMLLYTSDTSQNMPTIKQETTALLQERHLEAKNLLDYQYVSFSGLQDQSFINTDKRNINAGMGSEPCVILVTTLDDYNQNMQQNETLNDDEILLYANRDPFGYDHLEVFSYEFKIKNVLDDFMGNGNNAANVVSSYFIVVKDEAILNDLYVLQKNAYQDFASELYHYYGFDLDTDKETKITFYETLEEKLDALDMKYTIESKQASYNNFIALYGGFLFIGIFLSILFVMATILIIYYKQISEGYEDKDRFEIMQKVGMDHKLVKKSINSQVLTVFFLPLVVAVIHLIFAFPIIEKMLAMLMLSDMKLFIYCTIGCIATFTVAYVLIYSFTAKSYYAIVKRD